jgi:hypothetical protein
MFNHQLWRRLTAEALGSAQAFGGLVAYGLIKLLFPTTLPTTTDEANPWTVVTTAKRHA